ncbi:MAG: flavodoxin-dependent (E)-4-hydroxy-3-methylbut-2-enyl-diphosphate synthase, partial [Ferruginibacter sp.]
KWHIADAAADFIFTDNKIIDFKLPGTLNVICNFNIWNPEIENHYPLFDVTNYLSSSNKSKTLNFVKVQPNEFNEQMAKILQEDKTITICINASGENGMLKARNFINELIRQNIKTPVILFVESDEDTIDGQLIDFSIQAGAIFLDGMGDGIWLRNDAEKIKNSKVSGRTYLPTKDNRKFLNNTAFSILQAVRTRISKTEYISCPSCGRTLFDLQETTAKIRNVTSHLKGLKIAIMGCIVNGPGEMADADFGYVGSGPGKITLYKGKEVIKRNINSNIAVEELINLLKENNVWLEPANVLQ